MASFEACINLSCEIPSIIFLSWPTLTGSWTKNALRLHNWGNQLTKLFCPLAHSVGIVEKLDSSWSIFLPAYILLYFFLACHSLKNADRQQQQIIRSRASITHSQRRALDSIFSNSCLGKTVTQLALSEPKEFPTHLNFKWQWHHVRALRSFSRSLSLSLQPSSQVFLRAHSHLTKWVVWPGWVTLIDILFPLWPGKASFLRFFFALLLRWFCRHFCKAISEDFCSPKSCRLLSKRKHKDVCASKTGPMAFHNFWLFFSLTEFINSQSFFNSPRSWCLHW